MPAAPWPGSSSAAGGGGGGGGSSTVYYEDHGDASESDVGGAHKDAVVSLTVRALEEARLRGWGTRSLDLGHQPSIHGGTLYQIRSLLFARRALESLCVPALPEARQVYAGVSIPSLRELTLRCRYAEHPDVLGALVAFAEQPAHAGVRTLALTDATQLPIGLGRLQRKPALRAFLAQLANFHISGRAHALPGEAGAQRHLLRFVAAMTRLRSLKYHGYVPGLPCFQVLRVFERTLAVPLEELSIVQPSLEGSTPREDAHLYKQLFLLPPPTRHPPVTVDLTLGVALEAPELGAFASLHGARLRTLEVTLTYDALTALRAVTEVHAGTLRTLSITVLPAPAIEAAVLWQTCTNAVEAATQLSRLRFAPMLPTHAPLLVAAQLVAAVPAATELAIHAPGAASPRDAHDAYTALLSAAESTPGLQRLHATLSAAPVEQRTQQAADAARRSVPDIVLGRREDGDDIYKAVKVIDPRYAKRLWPVVFLLKPWLANSVIVGLVAAVLLGLTALTFFIAVQVVKRMKANEAAETAAEGGGSAFPGGSEGGAMPEGDPGPDGAGVGDVNGTSADQNGTEVAPNGTIPNADPAGNGSTF